MQNIQQGIKAGTTIKLTYHALSVTELEKALQEILSNSNYSKNAKKRSRIFKDQPQKPLDRAVFWVEWMLRHKDDYSTIIPPSKTLHWFILNGYDVLLVLIIILYLIVSIVQKIVCKIFCQKKCIEKDKKEK